MQGLILKGISGFYAVKAADAVYECRARGVFRKEQQKPLAVSYTHLNSRPEPMAYRQYEMAW